MTNWRQIQARIRKARVGADAPAKLLSLYDKTRDAMVAFELARAYEKDNRTEEAIEWYKKSIERFRRDDWKRKSAEAITRLGGTPPIWAPSAESAPGEAAPGGTGGEAAAQGAEQTSVEPEVSARTSAGGSTPVGTGRPFGAGLPSQLFYSSAAKDSGEGAPAERAEGEGAPAELSAGSGQHAVGTPGTETAPGVTGDVAGGLPRGKRRRRGRRGGRGRRKPGAPAPGVAPGAAAPQHSRPAHGEHAAREERPRGPEHRPMAAPAAVASTIAPGGSAGAAEEPGWVGPRTETLRARAGDPALASQIAQLEMQVRRLIACPPHKLEDADLAPAGPGVLILSDSDLTTHYYVVACATLRIEMGRLGRSDRGARGRDAGPSLRSRLAEHLGINESQVSRYLNQHCVARWLQLDEGASRLAHFAIAVLRPPLND